MSQHLYMVFVVIKLLKCIYIVWKKIKGKLWKLFSPALTNTFSHITNYLFPFLVSNFVQDIYYWSSYLCTTHLPSIVSAYQSKVEEGSHLRSALCVKPFNWQCTLATRHPCRISCPKGLRVLCLWRVAGQVLAMTTTDWLASQHLRNLYQATRNVAHNPLVRQTWTWHVRLISQQPQEYYPFVGSATQWKSAMPINAICAYLKRSDSNISHLSTLIGWPLQHYKNYDVLSMML